MVQIGYHASHEQHPPGDLARFVEEAEGAGFAAAMCSDHFHPWSDRQGQSGFAWSWLGAALRGTEIPIGVVNAPGQRYHPALVAQAAATLAEMFPGRFWLAVGSGQNLNEHVTGDPWPPKAARNERLLEAVDVIRRLWGGETVSHKGHFVVEDAKLYTLPPSAPLLLGAALTPATAGWVGGWADGLITIAGPHEQMTEVVEAFRKGGGRKKPMFLQTQISYADSDEEAERAAVEQWGTNIFPSRVLADLRMPGDFEEIAEFVRGGDVRGPVRVSADLEEHVEWLRHDIELGFSGIFLHNVHRGQAAFIRDFGERVLPAVGAS